MGKEIAATFGENDVVFVASSLGVTIKILKVGWNLISKVKHPDLEGKLEEVVRALQQPDTVLVSDQSPNVFLYHRRVDNKYMRVVCRHYKGEGFLITAHYIKEPKGGQEVDAS